VLMGIALLAVGCDRGQTRSDDTRGGEVETSNDSGDLLESKGDSCWRDPDCSGYLRCLEETCRIPPAVEGRADEETPVVTLSSPDDESGAEPAEYDVELATTAAERRRGLMFRPKLAAGWGMLFVYPREAPRSFWMKQTYIGLDMVFMDGEGRVLNVIESAEPRTLEPRRSEGAARFVLEISAGAAADAGIEPGWRMSTENVPDAHTPDR